MQIRKRHQLETSDITTWQSPKLDGSNPVVADEPSEPEGLNVEDLRQQAYQEGFESGKTEAYDTHRQDILSRLTQLDQLLAAMQQPFAELNDDVARELTKLSCRIAGQVARTEITADGQIITAKIQHALTILGSHSRNVSIRLHPSDAANVTQLKDIAGANQSHQVIEDATISPGGCIIDTADSHIDATTDAELNAILNDLLNETRDDEDL